MVLAPERSDTPLDNQVDAQKPFYAEESTDPPENQNHGDFAAHVTLIDERGWKQKVRLAFTLAVKPQVPKLKSEEETKVFTKMCINQVQVSVPQSTCSNKATQPPQLQIRQVKVVLSPSIDKIVDKNSVPEDYRDKWHITKRRPVNPFHGVGFDNPLTVGVEKSIAATVNFSMSPSLTFEISNKRTRSQQLPAVSGRIDLDKSKCHETPTGGLSWIYEVIQKPRIADDLFQLDRHSGVSVVPKANPPTSIEATVATIFDIRKDKKTKFAIFTKTVCGFSIGYRHIIVTTRVDVHWSKTDFAVFPTKDQSGCLLDIVHRFEENVVEGPSNLQSSATMDHEVRIKRTK